MVRGNRELKKIENERSRKITFRKRNRTLLKKAEEICVLCDVEVALITFSSKGKLFQFSSRSNLHDTIEHYRSFAKDLQIIKKRPVDQNLQQQQPNDEIAAMKERLKKLEDFHRKLHGLELSSFNLEELEKLEEQLEKSASCIRARKDEILKEQYEQLREKEKELKAENARLNEELWDIEEFPFLGYENMEWNSYEI